MSYRSEYVLCVLQVRVCTALRIIDTIGTLLQRAVRETTPTVVAVNEDKTPPLLHRLVAGKTIADLTQQKSTSRMPENLQEDVSHQDIVAMVTSKWQSTQTQSTKM